MTRTTESRGKLVKFIAYRRRNRKTRRANFDLNWVFHGRKESRRTMDPHTNHTISTEEILKKSNSIDPSLFDRYLKNQKIDEPAYTILITMYVVLIILGALGNTLVVRIYFFFFCNKKYFSIYPKVLNNMKQFMCISKKLDVS